jgi:hypothetical protein
MSRRHIVLILLLTGPAACTDSPTALPVTEALLARGGPTVQRADFTIADAGMSVVSDGKGQYRDGVCGVVGSWASDVTYLAVADGSIPKSQQASCTGIAPRAAKLTLAVRHLSDNPHVDDVQSPVGGGVFSVSNIKFGWGTALATTVNAPFSCGAIGLRFTSVTYPGTDNVVRDNLGNGVWHMYTRPFPDNRAYCEVGGVPTYWHVSLDVTVAIKP